MMGLPHRSRRRPAATILVYGATGYTGSLVVRAAVRRGIRPVLAGRSDEPLVRLAAELGLEHRVATLADPSALTRMLAGIGVLVNAAGPFSETWAPLVEASLRCRVHYVDLASEVLVIESIRARGADAKRRGVALVPAAGFEVVPSDCLAAHVAARLPEATMLRLAVSGLELVSAGSARTMAHLAGRPLLVRRAGRLVTMPAGSLERMFDYGSGPAASVAVSWGDLATAFNTTGIANIDTYFEATPAVRTVVAANRFLAPLLGAPSSQATLQQMANWLPRGPDAAERNARKAVLVAEAEDPSGRVVRARLQTPEAYTLSAETAAAISAEVAAGNYEPGFQTPAGLFGADFILGFEGVTRDNAVI
jgi:short subunit dehydrogenase-like uncharacterized protein